MKINKYLPFTFIYFFINSLGLPFGLTYTTLLSPFFYWWICITRKQEVLLPFLALLAPFVIIHITVVGVDVKSYVASVVNLVAVYIFCQAFYTFLKKCEDPQGIFKKLLIFNFILVLIAIPLYFTPYHTLLWIQQNLTDGINDFKRLKLFTYEASYYATLYVPLFFFFLLQILLKQNKINIWLLLTMLLVPYVLSFSLGVISTLFIVICLGYLFYFKTLMRKNRVVNLLFLLFSISIPLVGIILIFFPDNTLFFRVQNIFSGLDTSGKGRTSEAFMLAGKLLDQKNIFWGIGPGQIKILGNDIIRDYYLYPLEYTTLGIPNATAETLAIFGWAGLFLRMLIEIFLFFYTKVWKSHYRLLLFLFIFLYQFTGSFITNIAEYVIWILAFTEVFPQFLVKPYANNNLNDEQT